MDAPGAAHISDEEALLMQQIALDAVRGAADVAPDAAGPAASGAPTAERDGEGQRQYAMAPWPAPSIHPPTPSDPQHGLHHQVVSAQQQQEQQQQGGALSMEQRGAGGTWNLVLHPQQPSQDNVPHSMLLPPTTQQWPGAPGAAWPPHQSHAAAGGAAPPIQLAIQPQHQAGQLLQGINPQLPALAHHGGSGGGGGGGGGGAAPSAGGYQLAMQHSVSSALGLPPAGGPGGVLCYPPAEATQAAVLSDRVLFTSTLKRLHEVLGSRYRVPVVGGQELDLWMLYRQVVAHDGLATVVLQKKWADVCAPFNFPSTFTSRSYTMRKLYSQILWHYEQVYMHGNTGQLLAPPVPEPATSGLSGPLAGAPAASALPAGGTAKRRAMDRGGAPAPLQPLHLGSLAAPHQQQQLLLLGGATPAGGSAYPLAGSGVAPLSLTHGHTGSGTLLYTGGSAGQLQASSLETMMHYNGPPSSRGTAGPPPLMGMHMAAVSGAPAQAQPYEQINVGDSVQGVVTHRFDHGVFVHVAVGGSTFQGVLYTPPQAGVPAAGDVPPPPASPPPPAGGMGGAGGQGVAMQQTQQGGGTAPAGQQQHAAGTAHGGSGASGGGADALHPGPQDAMADTLYYVAAGASSMESDEPLSEARQYGPGHLHAPQVTSGGSGPGAPHLLQQRPLQTTYPDSPTAQRCSTPVSCMRRVGEGRALGGGADGRGSPQHATASPRGTTTATLNPDAPKGRVASPQAMACLRLTGPAVDPGAQHKTMAGQWSASACSSGGKTASLPAGHLVQEATKGVLSGPAGPVPRSLSPTAGAVAERQCGAAQPLPQPHAAAWQETL